MVSFLRNVALGLCLVLFFSGPLLAQIKIGAYLPLSGQNAFGGQLELEGIEVAAKKFPEILGQKIELVVMDNKSDPYESAKVVKTLIEKEKVVAILGTYGSSLALAGGEVAEAAKVPVVGTSCTNPLVTQDKDYYFRAGFIDPYQAAGAATYAYKNLGATKAAILVDTTNDYSVSLGAYFKRSFTALGGEIVSEVFYHSDDDDFSEQLTEFIAKSPDVLFAPAYFIDGAHILQQAREMGATFRIMGGDAMDNPEIVKLPDGVAEGFIHTSFPYDVHMPDMNPDAKEFTEAWHASFPDKEPNVNAALGYTAYIMVYDAIKRAGVASSAAITEALNNVQDFPTPFGHLTLDEYHNPQMAVGIIEIKDKKRVYLDEIKPVLE